MFRQIIVILLLVAFGAQVFNRALLLADYYANKTYFASNCENKARPALHCNGKCQMMKKMKAEEKKEQDNPERKGENKIDVFSSKSFFATLSVNFIEIQKSYSVYNTDFFPRGTYADIFHPPALV